MTKKEVTIILKPATYWTSLVLFYLCVLSGVSAIIHQLFYAFEFYWPSFLISFNISVGIFIGTLLYCFVFITINYKKRRYKENHENNNN